MTNSFKKFMESLDMNKGDMFSEIGELGNILRKIEYTSHIQKEDLVAASENTMILTSPAPNWRGYLNLLRNYIRFHNIQFAFLVRKAKDIAKDKDKVINVPDENRMLFFSKRIARTLHNIFTKQGEYANYIQDKKEGEIPDSVVGLAVDAYIFENPVTGKYELIMVSVTRGLRLNRGINGEPTIYKFEEIIETVF